MKLWLISQDENNGYDTYDKAVVAAETEEQARTIHPGGCADYWLLDNHYRGHAYHYADWARSLDRVSVTLIGDALPERAAGVICASFNAG